MSRKTWTPKAKQWGSAGNFGPARHSVHHPSVPVRKDNDNVTPETASARIKQLNDRDPHRLRKRMTKNALRTHKGEITKQQAADMADSTIAVALEANPEEVAAMCNEILIQDGESADFVLE